MNNKIIIILSGFTKSKKSSIARIIREFFDAEIIEMSTPFRVELNGEITVDKLLDGLFNYRKKNGEASLSDYALKKVGLSRKRICIIPGVRNFRDFSNILCSEYLVHTVFIYSSASTRHNRLNRDPTSIAKNFLDYSKLDKITYREGIEYVAKNSKYIIINEPCYPLTLLEQVAQIVKDIVNNSEIPIKLKERNNFMNDKGVTITKLPVYDKKYKGEKDIISRILKPKGELATISINTINYLAYVDFPLDGKPRANHYHEEKYECLYLIKGKVKLFVRRGGHPDADVDEYIVEEGTLINMHPGYAHAYVAVEEGFAVEFSPTTYDVIERDKVRDYVIK